MISLHPRLYEVRRILPTFIRNPQNFTHVYTKFAEFYPRLYEVRRILPTFLRSSQKTTRDKT
ncbi:hypothetical protein [Leptospira gomenensis]|uniref:hypothetical protein n=1 Tax=Leptospira gomenensis TaxID=2484974 RepID=UPI001090EBB2|nr:hypothetical protein [Leptospira gomenensis]